MLREQVQLAGLDSSEKKASKFVRRFLSISVFFNVKERSDFDS